MLTWPLIGIAVIIGLVVLADRGAKRRLAALFAGRTIRTDGDFYDTFFSGSEIPREIVAKIRAIFREQCGIDLSRLEADDDLSTDFRILWELDSLADVEIIVALEKEFALTITNEEATSLHTVRQVAEFIWQKTKPVS